MTYVTSHIPHCFVCIVWQGHLSRGWTDICQTFLDTTMLTGIVELCLLNPQSLRNQVRPLPDIGNAKLAPEQQSLLSAPPPPPPPHAPPKGAPLGARTRTCITISVG